MILVDSSVWIDYFRDATTPHVDLLVRLLLRRRVLIGDLILTEVLQSVRNDRNFALIRDRLDKAKPLAVCDAHVAVAAAQNYRTLRAKGVTVRKTIDVLITTRCIVDRIPLLYSDRDFDPFVEHLGLIPAFQAASGATQ